MSVLVYVALIVAGAVAGLWLVWSVITAPIDPLPFNEELYQTADEFMSEHGYPPL